MAGLWFVRWLRAVLAFGRGVRVHPTAVLSGGSRRLRVGRNSSLGPRTRFTAGDAARIFVGEGCWFAADVELDTETAIFIGAGTTVQRRCSINGTTRIGRGCILAPNIFVSSGTHPFRAFPELPIRKQESLLAQYPERAAAMDRPVWIQPDCWLGANVVVCPGVVIGRGSIVGANAVVLKDVRPYSVVGGVPAKIVGARLDWRPRSAVDANDPGDHVYVLSGQVLAARDGDHAGFATGAQEPLQIAIAPSARLRLDYQASQPLAVRVGERVHELRAGTHFIEFDATQLPARDDHVIVTVEAMTTVVDALRVTRISG